MFANSNVLSDKSNPRCFRFILTAIIAVMGFVFGLTTSASAQGDTTPPTLADLVIDTPVIDTTSSSDIARLSLNFEDDISGVLRIANFIVRSPSGSQVLGSCGV